MKLCTNCGLVITEDMMFYETSDLCSEMMSAVESKIKRESNEEDCLCERCFDIVSHVPQTNEIKVEVPDSHDPFIGIPPDVHGELDVTDQYEENNTSKAELTISNLEMCAWCLKSIQGKPRTHYLPIPERNELAKLVFPRKITHAHRVCNNCWILFKRTVNLRKDNVIATSSALDSSGPSNIEVEVKIEPEETIDKDGCINFDQCVWCQKEISNVKTFLLNDGPEKDLISARIRPREFAPGQRVCKSCWNEAKNLTRQTSKRRKCNDTVETILHKKKKKEIRTSVTEDGDESDEETKYGDDSNDETKYVDDSNDETWEPPTIEHKKIELEREKELVKIKKIGRKETERKKEEELVNVDSKQLIVLPNYRLTSNTSTRCLVLDCPGKERKLVPEYLKKVLLESYKFYVTPFARICNEHVKEYYRDWSFLKDQNLSNKFSASAVEHMLDLFRDDATTTD